MESEKVTEIYLRKQIEALGGKCWKWVSPMIRGVPDRICLLPRGCIFFVEVKSEGKDLSSAQERRFNDLSKLGFTCYMVSTKAKVDKIIMEELYDSRPQNSKRDQHSFS